MISNETCSASNTHVLVTADMCDPVTSPEGASVDPMIERDSSPEPGEITEAGTTSMRASYDTSFKLKVIDKAAELGSNRRAAAYFGIHEKQVRCWRSVSEELLKSQATTRRMHGAGRPLADKSLDDKLLALIRQMQDTGGAIRWTVVKQRARELSKGPDFKASWGWLQAFKTRHGFTAAPGRACRLWLAVFITEDRDGIVRVWIIVW